MELNLFLTISKFQNHYELYKFTSLCKRLRIFVIQRFNQVIIWLLYKYGTNRLPRWCYMKMDIGPYYGSLAQQVQRWKIERISPIPSFLNIKGGILSGGAVAQEVFRYWHFQTDYDIFIPNHDTERYPKRAKVEFDGKKLDLVFKSNDISEFDISVTQIGINIDTNVVFATPLFLFSYKNNVMVCRLSSFQLNYDNNFNHPVFSMFDYHLNNNHKTVFHKCGLCLDEAGDDVFYSAEFFVTFQHWIERVQKYEDRFPNYEIKFVKYE